MYFGRLFYFHLISCGSILKHFLSLNKKANALQCSYIFPVNEHLARQARQCSQAMLSITRSSASLSEAAWNQCVFAGPSDPCWHSCPAFWGCLHPQLHLTQWHFEQEQLKLWQVSLGRISIRKCWFVISSCSSHETGSALGCSQHDPMTLHIK